MDSVKLLEGAMPSIHLVVDQSLNKGDMKMASKIEETMKQLRELQEQMKALAASADEGGEITAAKLKLDSFKSDMDAFDVELNNINVKKQAIVDKMAPYHELLRMTGNAHVTMGKVRKSGSIGTGRGKVKDPETGIEYANGAEACRANNIDVGGASAIVKWKQAKGTDLIRVE